MITLHNWDLSSDHRASQASILPADPVRGQLLATFLFDFNLLIVFER